MFLRHMATVALVVTSVLVAACARDDLTRFGYQLGAQHTCMQANTGLTYESVKDLECMSGAVSADAAYDEFERARRQELDGQ